MGIVGNLPSIISSSPTLPRETSPMWDNSWLISLHLLLNFQKTCAKHCTGGMSWTFSNQNISELCSYLYIIAYSLLNGAPGVASEGKKFWHLLDGSTSISSPVCNSHDLPLPTTWQCRNSACKQLDRQLRSSASSSIPVCSCKFCFNKFQKLHLENKKRFLPCLHWGFSCRYVADQFVFERHAARKIR